MRYMSILLLLFCLPAFAGELNMKLSWTVPTQNADGTSLTNLAGYRIIYGTSPSNLTQSVSLTNPGLTTYTIPLTPGTWYGALISINSAGDEGAVSNVASALVTAPATPVPLLTVGPYGYEATGTAAAPTMSAIGLVQGGASCGNAVKIIGATKFCQIAISQIDVVGWPQDKTLAKGVWARAQ